MSKENFLAWQPDDALFTYEFNDGLLESTPGMKQNEARIVRNIEDNFYETGSVRQQGRLLTEFDCWVTDRQMRRPDLAFYTNDQIDRMDEGKHEIPAFIIEIISEYDEFGQMTTKLHEYFSAGVQVVWWVLPSFALVYGFTSPKSVVIATATDPVSVLPVLPAIQMTADSIFRR